MSLDNWEESAAFIMTSANGSKTFKSSRIRTKNRMSRLTALSLTWFLWDVKGLTPLFEKNGRGCRPRWCGQSFLGWVGYL